MFMGYHSIVINPWFRVWVTSDNESPCIQLGIQNYQNRPMINLSGRKPNNEKYSPISMFIIALYHIMH